jgi:tetratricopeptide (TPR) repeat protein
MAKIILRAGKVAFKIILLFTILGFIFYSVKVLVPAKANVESVPDELSSQFEQAGAYLEEGQYEEAEQIYWDILDLYPGTDDALAAQTQLTILYINWDKPADAEAALQQLKSDFAAHPEIPLEVCRVAEAYFDTGQPEKSKQLYEHTFNTWPNYAWYEQEGIGHILIFANSCSESGQPQKALDIYRDIFDGQRDVWNAIEAWQAIEAVQLYEGLRITLGEDPNVQPIVDKYIPRFLEEEKSVEALYDIASAYKSAGAVDKANAVYQAILDNWGANKDKLWAREFSIKADIALGNDPDITKELNELIVEFADNSDLPEALCVIAEEYGVKASELKSQGLENETKEYFQKAFAVWERVIHEFPDCDVVPRAYYCSAGCYELELSEYEKAIEYYQQLLDNWPYFDYRRASYAQFGIARCYQNLEKSGKISTEEAANKIRQACNNLLANYPETNPVIIQTARKLLDKYQVSA